MAEPEGFEPSIPGKRYAALAKRCLQPLGHSSNAFDMPDTEARRKRQIASGAFPAVLFDDPPRSLRAAATSGRKNPGELERTRIMARGVRYRRTAAMAGGGAVLHASWQICRFIAHMRKIIAETIA